MRRNRAWVIRMTGMVAILACILPPVSGTAADPSVNEQPLRSSLQGQTARPPGATSPEGVPKLDTQAQMPVNILKGKVVASAPKSLQIQVTGEESSTPISVGVGLKTKYIPFRRPAVGETVEVEYQDENGNKFGYVVKMVGVPPRATIPAVTPKPDLQSQMPVKQVTGEEPGTEATLDEQLLEAVRHGDVALAKTLLNSGADTIDLKKMREPGSCLLMEACRKGRIDIVKLLLDKGASANDGSALAAAAGGSYLPGHGGGHLDVVKLLVERGADVNAESDDCLDPSGDFSVTALQVAAREGHLELVRYLLEKGADPKAEMSYAGDPGAGGNNAVTFAARNGHTEIVKLFLEKGEDVNRSTSGGMTALMAACSGDELETAQFLLGRGANVNARCKEGNTPLFYALPNAALVKLLIDKGADPTIKNEEGLTVLDIARDKHLHEISTILRADQPKKTPKRKTK